MQITFRLMQLDGVQGPHKTIELENPDPHPAALRHLARSWAAEQTGHPWDSLTVEYRAGGEDRVIEVEALGADPGPRPYDVEAQRLYDAGDKTAAPSVRRLAAYRQLARLIMERDECDQPTAEDTAADACERITCEEGDQ